MKVYGWGFGDTEPVNDLPPAPPGEPLRGVGSGRCADVPGFSTTNGTQLDLWDGNGGGNQSITSVTNPALCLNAAGTGNGSPVNVATCNGDSNQAWTRS